MPSICDPGEDLVRSAIKHAIDIICIPGPCAALTALISSGYPDSKFIFEGFLPKKKEEREKVLSEISENEKTTVIFESPHRLSKLLIELKEYCGGQREISISRELTKKFEEHVNNNIDKVIEYFNEREILGEITIVIKGSVKKSNSNFNESLLKKDLHDLVNAGLSLSAASKYLAKKHNLSKNTLYNLY